MRVLSLFDGISCGMLALQRAGIPVEEYHAFEIDKYAVSVSKRNFPEIVHHGDVCKGDFTQYKGFDLLLGGSPCTYWSVARTNRETTIDGEGFRLFMEFVRALRESECPHFLYENNYSIHKNIVEEISKQLGVKPIMVDSALVSAQSRKRLYWTNIPNFKPPVDRGIRLSDIIDSGVTWQDKSYCVTSCYHPTFRDNLEKHRNTLIAEPLAVNDENGKARTLKAQYGRTAIANAVRTDHFGATMVAEPVYGAAQRGRYTEDGNTTEQHIEIRQDGKSNCLTTVQKDTLICKPIRVGEYGRGGQGQRIYSVHGKSVTLSANGGGRGAKTGLYKIDLPDGDYIIRKLTPVEAERLQTLPDNYTAGISNTQRYKCIGNGWTVDVIAHILRGLAVQS